MKMFARSAADKNGSCPPINKMGAVHAVRKRVLKGIQRKAAKGSRIRGAKPEYIGGRTEIPQPPERSFRHELKPGDAFEKISGQHFAAELHNAESSEQIFPLEGTGFPKEELPKEKAVTLEELADPVFFSFLNRDRI